MPSLDPEGLGSMMSGMMSNSLPRVGYWMGVILVSVVVLIGLYFLYQFLMYKYNVTIFVRGGAGKGEDDHSIRQIKSAKGREFMDNGVEKFGFMFKKQKIDPIPMKYIYPGNKIFLYQTGTNEFIPVKFGCSNPEAYFNPLPYSIRRWQMLEQQEAIRDYQDQSFMQKYGGMMLTLGAMIFCCILVGAVIFMTYKYIGTELGQAAAAAKTLGESLRDTSVQKFGGG